MEAGRFDLAPAGYFAKRTVKPPDWLVAGAVTEICSVSDCIAPAPDGWMEHWLHNDLGFFNTRSDALSVLPPDAAGFSLFAYRLAPLRFEKGNAAPAGIPPLSVEALDSAFVSLGFDVVSRSISAFFECSPLSCNAMAAEIPVNRYCLIPSLEEAISAAERFSREEPEPGPYYVLEVLREQPQNLEL